MLWPMDEPILYKSARGKHLATRLWQVRLMRGLTHEVVAKRAGTLPAFVIKAEERGANIYPHMLRRLAIALCTSPEDLMAGAILPWPIWMD